MKPPKQTCWNCENPAVLRIKEILLSGGSREVFTCLDCLKPTGVKRIQKPASATFNLKLNGGLSQTRMSDNDPMIRKVKALNGRARAEAERMKLSQNDLVIVRTTTNSLPQYSLEKIDGDPITYLQNRAVSGDVFCEDCLARYWNKVLGAEKK